MVPAGGVKSRAREAAKPGEVRDDRFGECPGREHYMPRGPPASRRLQRPELLGRAPAQFLDRTVEDQAAAQVELVGDAAEVGVQLMLLGVRVAPVRVRCERERVQVALHVHRSPGVVVVAPHPTDVAGTIDQHEIVEPSLLQPHGGRDPAEPGADDHDVIVSNSRHRRLSSQSR